MPSPAEALRTGVAWLRMDHVHALIVEGPEAFDLLDEVLPRPLFVRKGQILPAALLDEQARPVADLEVCCLGEDFLVLSEGLDAEALAARLRADSDMDVPMRAIDDVILGVHGPYAWEVVADLFGDGIIGMPYLTSFDLQKWGGRGLRSGKTGEFGYLLMVPAERAEAATAELVEIAARYDGLEIDLDTLDVAALENGFFSMRHHADMPTLRELQLMWRMAWDRDFVGRGALRDRRGEAVSRVSWIALSPDAALPAVGASVHANGEQVGAVLCARHSETLGRGVVLALLAPEHAWPDIPVDIAGVAGRTAAPPLLHNRSLHIDTQRHAWLSRESDRFPPIVPETA